jgi:hypothetical protein
MIKRPVDRKLESFKIFPYIAWGLVILFIIFVYKLSTTLDTKAEKLDKETSSLEQKANVESKDLRNINFEE